MSSSIPVLQLFDLSEHPGRRRASHVGRLTWIITTRPVIREAGRVIRAAHSGAGESKDCPRPAFRSPCPDRSAHGGKARLRGWRTVGVGGVGVWVTIQGVVSLQELRIVFGLGGGRDRRLQRARALLTPTGTITATTATRSSCFH